MNLNKEYESLPPKAFMMQILDATSKNYIFLWEKRDDFNRVKLSRDELKLTHHMNTFNTSLKKLHAAGLLDFRESYSEICIELVGWDDLDGLDH